MGITCCRKSMFEIESILLYDLTEKTHRVLSVYQCRNPKCKNKKATITYFDKIKGKFIKENIPQKNLEKTIQAYKKSPYLSDINKTFKQGSKSNMFWKYQRDGNIYDFNEIKQS